MNVWISIATYNEKDNIVDLIPKIFDSNPSASIIIIDDASPDGTGTVVADMQKKFSQLFLIERSGKLGYGTAHVAGFLFAIEHAADVVVSMDADFSHDPLIIPGMIKLLEGGADVVVGSRRVKGGAIVGWGAWRKFCSRGAMMFSKCILGITTNDLTSGFRAYSKKVIQSVDWSAITSNGYSFLEELIYILEKRGFAVKEIPICFQDRQRGKSKLSHTEIVKFFITIFKIKLSAQKWKNKE